MYLFFFLAAAKQPTGGGGKIRKPDVVFFRGCKATD